MQIRQATPNDITGILNVLKASLGETSSKKTEEVWRFKHIDNPFGESLVLIAEDSGMIVGVRAFMRWQWKRGEKVYSAFRAVDTATHPNHQGKGIFKKLTLAALELGLENGDHFVFNTPNSLSKPGYLKMGWEEVGKLHTLLIPNSPIYWNSKLFESYPINWTYDNKNLIETWNITLNRLDCLYTPKNIDYLEWRYKKNPLQNYRIEANSSFFIAGYIKQQKKIKELRISELIICGEDAIKDCNKIIKKWAKEYGVHFISLNDLLNLNLFKIKIAGNFGPVLTFKSLRKNNIEKDFQNLDKWAYSLGDMELF